MNNEELNGEKRLHPTTLTLYLKPTTNTFSWPKSFHWVGWAVSLVGRTCQYHLLYATTSEHGTGGQNERDGWAVAWVLTK